ncbi:interactor of constitutive active ROPs 4-like [Nicotiana tomentosiformis]|uniref:interactor of constitutive active ROPs 4-like n=1 Tax=Nicotiana tomentosiformis TaxID=4098 RepID=UPI00388C7046
MDPDRKRSIIITILEDAQVLSTPVGVVSYLRCLVTEEDQAKMNEVDVSCLFNEAQQSLNWLEAEARELTEKKETYKLLSEQHEEAIKNLRAELDAAQKEYADLVEQELFFEVSDDDLAIATNDQTSQVQQKVDRIDQLRAKMNEVQAMADVWKERIDRLASEKETAQEHLASVKVQLQVAKEKSDAQARQNEDLQAQLGSTIDERDALGKELKIARSESETTRADAEEMVAQYRASVEAVEARLKVTVEYVKRFSRRETLEVIHTCGFDFSTEIKNARG